MLGANEGAIQCLLLESLDPLGARDRVLTVGLEHEGELEVEETGERFSGRCRARAERLLGDARERDANERHRREHVTLRKADLDVHAADLLALGGVRLVVDAGEDAPHPRL